ncbi:MAG: mobilization protein [Leptospiraceae bacterium]|nr:mobilization protein [Leptospiraceae bacterium]MBK9503656.1 mobilization protein [Leptospiraceae bacterium]MBL0265486.1 mobilization protein [Leptospiraceae bacterium]
MRMIHFIGGEKGGVGKSVISRLLAQYFIDNQIPFKGYDTDRSHNTFLRFYEDFASPTTVDSYEHLDAMIENYDLEMPSRIIVDLAAQTTLPLQKWIEESNVVELSKELNLNLRFWHVMDDSKDSVILLENLLNRFQDKVEYTIVFNQGRGTQFKIFESSSVKDLAASYNATFVNLKKLHERTMQKIDETNSSFWAAIHNKPQSLGLMEKERVKTWLNSAYDEFRRINV